VARSSSIAVSPNSWGIAMASDTALALGILAVAAPRAQQRLRAFVLTVLVVNDLVALAVIAAVFPTISM
jgi:Na+/H+ antiporter NhaA